MADMSAEVSAMMREVAALHILPRFRLLKDGDIEEKSKGDYVTIADREAELWLTPRLEALLPGSHVLGEEAVAADPSRMSLIETDAPLWTVDPVDGTGNFVNGRETFGVMIGLSQGGETRHAWIYLPVSDDLITAEQGGGSFRISNGVIERLKTGYSVANGGLSGAFNYKLMPEDWRDRTKAYAKRIPHRWWSFCSAWDYVGLARGQLDMITYYRMLPWDHVPGALIVREAGGVIRNMETGEDYRLPTIEGPHLVARSEEDWERFAAEIKREMP